MAPFPTSPPRAAPTALGVAAADLVSKALAASPRSTVETIHNPSLLLEVASPPRLVTLLLALVGLILFGAVLMWRVRRALLPGWVAGLLVGGAVGNLVDRLMLGAVRDFIATPWLVFNLADVAIVLGVVAYLWTLIATTDG